MDSQETVLVPPGHSRLRIGETGGGSSNSGVSAVSPSAVACLLALQGVRPTPCPSVDTADFPANIMPAPPPRLEVPVAPVPNMVPAQVPEPPVPTQENKRCSDCGATTTPMWRKGADGKKTLCNACGARLLKRKQAGR